MGNFFDDVWRGLNASPKYLESKYFYDETGDALFREIMDCPEYYLTRCELDIFMNQSADMAAFLRHSLGTFDVAELGAGDCSKSVCLLQALAEGGAGFTYYPVDISANVIALLDNKLPQLLPSVKLHGLNGDYFDMLGELQHLSQRNKVVLFLGSNVGNIPLDETIGFFKTVRAHLTPGDLLITGFDLIKEPETILAAYNDAAGITKRFNLNLLQRINDRLSADFDLSKFEHKPVYDERTGTCTSYLESVEDQQVAIGSAGIVQFGKGERLHMETAQKYTVAQTDELATASGFLPVWHFYDSKGWFLDAVWLCQ